MPSSSYSHWMSLVHGLCLWILDCILDDSLQVDLPLARIDVVEVTGSHSLREVAVFEDVLQIQLLKQEELLLVPSHVVLLWLLLGCPNLGLRGLALGSVALLGEQDLAALLQHLSLIVVGQLVD